jgi:parallel beta-helix repeat protein
MRGFTNSAIEIYTTANIFSELTIEGNGGAGIHFRDDGTQLIFRNTLENSLINGNSGAGVLVSGAWGVTLSNNRITNNGAQGILLTSLNGSGPISAYSTQVIDNVIGGNGASGVEITGNGAQSNQLFRNFIGVDRNALALPNGTNGVLISNGASNNEVGGVNASNGNVIAKNNGVGVRILSGAPNTSDSVNNRILGNRIFSNGSFGIDLTQFDTANGVYPVASPNPDNPASTMNTPQLFSASSDGSITHVIGMLQAAPSANYRLEFFSNPTGTLPSVYAGTTIVGFQNITTDTNGYASIDFFSAVGSPIAGTITATATRAFDSNFLVFSGTSEFSASERIKPALSTPENLQIAIFTHNDVTDQTATGLGYALLVNQSDSANFSINGLTGELTFLNLPIMNRCPTNRIRAATILGGCMCW